MLNLKKILNSNKDFEEIKKIQNKINNIEKNEVLLIFNNLMSFCIGLFTSMICSASIESKKIEKEYKNLPDTIKKFNISKYNSESLLKIKEIKINKDLNKIFI